jgi:NADPH-dependent curcumin reductase CurA
MQYKAIKLVKRPTLTITPDLFETFVLETPELEEGQILLKQTHMSLDPAMKGWMTDDRNSYIPPVELGEIMRSSGVAEVVESKHEGFAAGDRVVGMIGWTEYAVSDGQGLNKLPPGISAEAVLCVLSLPGLTAYQGLMVIGKPKAGETLVVSGAAGSVGSMVGQLATTSAAGLRTSLVSIRRSTTSQMTWRGKFEMRRRRALICISKIRVVRSSRLFSTE